MERKFSRQLQASPQIQKDPGEICVFEHVPEDATGVFEDQLKGLLDYWVQVWRKVGGVRAVTKGLGK